MYKGLVATCFAAPIILLCACQQSVQPPSEAAGNHAISLPTSSPSSQGAIPYPSSSTSPNPPASTTPNIIWGEAGDSLKTYADHDGQRNQYRDYTMTLTFSSTGLGKALVLHSDDVGSQFLTFFQDLTLQDSQPPPPEGTDCLTLLICDSSEEYRYFLYSDGETYTAQNSKLYYLGETGFSYTSLLGMFIAKGLTEVDAKQAGTAALPYFDPFSESVTFTAIPAGSSLSLGYRAADCQVTVELLSYAERSTTLFVRDEGYKAKLLELLNQVTQIVVPQPVLGGGYIIRVLEEDTYYNYRIAGETLLDYSNQVAFLLPNNELPTIIRRAMAQELLHLLQ